MSSSYNYPGVYIEEQPSPVHTIVGVKTSVCAFVGMAKSGPIDEAVLIHSFSEFESIFGGLWNSSYLGHMVFHFFLNGGSDAVIIRVVHDGDADSTKNAKAAIITTNDATLTFKASNPGKWGEKIQIKIDDDVDHDKLQDDISLFHLYVKNTETGATENFLNVSLKSDAKRSVTNVLNEESRLIKTNVIGFTDKQPTALKFEDSTIVKDSASDGIRINDTDVEGSLRDDGTRTGLHLLDVVDIFNMLCIPPYADDDEPPWAIYTPVALDYCTRRRAILLVDPSPKWHTSSDAITGPSNVKSKNMAHQNAAIFFPRVMIPDPLLESRLKTFAPSGIVAGVIARTDGQRGVWKSPAGIEATLQGVSDLEVKLTDPQNGELNPLGINCLRSMPSGLVVWGSRTMRGADNLADQWKYLSIRRTALFIEETLYRATQWVVFEPNDEPLWSQIRLNVGAFMHDLFLKGAFQGNTPKEAYLVKCDKETTTQTDINKGIVNIVVGFQPLEPAEFVVIKIQQLAGQPGGT